MESNIPYALLEKIRQEKPLVHHITNWVTIEPCADITRSLGALPIMAHAKEEAAEMTGISSALVLNIGTLTSELVDAMEISAAAANRKGIPVVLDAVGAGATKMRTDACKRLLKNARIDVLKGNAGEIGSLKGVAAEVRGVESVSVAGDPKEIARELAQELGNVVVITGKEDIVSDGKRTFLVANGHEMMGNVVGTGCMSASAIASFCAVEKDYVIAATSALSIFGIAGENAAKKTNQPMAYKNALIDAISTLKKGENEARVKEWKC